MGSGTVSKGISVKLKVWRQKNADSEGRLVSYELDDVNPDASFLEMLDVLNEKLIGENKEPVEFDNDCREGICGSCGVVVNGIAHGPQKSTATCQLHMRHYVDGDTLVIEPWRSNSFPIVKDLVVDRSSFDRIIEAGGYTSVNTGNAQDANALPVSKENADKAMDFAACIGCGACAAACPNSSASLFTGAKISQLSLLPHGHPERKLRAKKMVDQMEKEGFGDCSNHGECEAVCPKDISIETIAIMRREYIKSIF